MCFTKSKKNSDKLEIVLPFTDKKPNSPKILELSNGKSWIKNRIIRELINLWLIEKDHYLSLKKRQRNVSDERIINGLWARAIKKWIKNEFDKIVNPEKKDKWDKL